MKFDIITIFPEIFSAPGGSAFGGGSSYGYFGASIIKHAIEKNLIDIKIHNLRDWTSDARKTVDDTPYGGGAGMVLKVEPIYKCLNSVESYYKNSKTRTILFSAKGKRFTQADAKRLSEYENLILICGRYEGVDERVAENLIDEEISIGDFVLTGGEIPAMILVDSISRLIPGVLGNDESSKEESHSQEGVLEFPQYTKPEEFNGWKVPEILLSGNHQKIKEWREEKSQNKK